MRCKPSCKSDGDSKCLKHSKLAVFGATATYLKAINFCSSKKYPSHKFERGLYLQFYRISANRATNLFRGLYFEDKIFIAYGQDYTGFDAIV